MEIKHQYFENENLLIQKISGVFSIEFYMKNIYKVYKVYNINEIRKVVVDFREMEFNNDTFTDIVDKRIEKMVSFRKEINSDKLKNQDVQLVMLVDKPMPTVIVHLFMSRFSKENYKYCSTSKKATEFLQINTNFDIDKKSSTLKYTITE